MIRGTLIAALFICNIGWAQTYKTARSLGTIQPDSCFLSVYLVATKEMVRSEDQVIEKLLDRKKVTNKDVKKLLEKGSRKSSYQNERVLLTHYNIIIDLYRSGSVYGSITLSSMTGNITINDITSGELTFGNVSHKFGEFIIQFLRDQNMLELIYSSDLQGFTKDFE